MHIYQERLLPENPALPVRCWRISGEAGCAAHWHSMMEIVYTRRGNAMQQVSQTFYPVAAGDISVICSDQLHSFVPATSEEAFDLIVLQFDVEFVISRVQSADAFSRDWLSGSLFFPSPIAADETISRLLEGILAEMQSRRDGYAQAVTGSLLTLLTRLYRMSPARLSAAERKADTGQSRQLLSDTFRLISECYQVEGLSVQQAAQSANLSVTHFCRLFKQATGMGFHEYLLHYRLSRAEQLFSSDKTLPEIAFACGFGSLSAFSRAFRKRRGCTPGHARKNYQ